MFIFCPKLTDQASKANVPYHFWYKELLLNTESKHAMLAQTSYSHRNRLVSRRYAAFRIFGKERA